MNTDYTLKLTTTSRTCTVSERRVSLFSFVLATLLIASLQDGRPAADIAAGSVAYAGRHTYDTSRVGCGSTEIGGTATDTSPQSVDRHKVVDEATIVLQSRGRLGHTCDDDTSVLWSVGSNIVQGHGHSSTQC